MSRNYQKDFDDLPDFAKKYSGRTTLECIEAYANRRKVVTHRIGNAFYALVDDGEIKIEQDKVDRLYYVI